MEFERLPKSVIPIRYKLLLAPDFTTFSLQGDLTIEIVVVQATDTIKLNASELQIQDVALKNVDIKPKEYKICSETEVLCITFNETIAAGQYNLYIKYTGGVNDSLRGFYRSKVENDEGKDVYYAATYFTPTEARKCFPCWDEPAFKAVFEISIKTSSSLVTLSNMPLKTSENFDDLVLHQFEPSPIMSTYLVAVVIGEYSYVEAQTSGGVKIRVYAPKKKVQQSQFALEVAVKALDFYSEYFSISYPLPKLDLIALADIEVGAMEHWGLITYRERLLLVDPESTSALVKEQVALTVAHEIAHQWFGNLVTMEWWTHIWLNEGYASFMQFLTIDRLYPDFDVWSSFIVATHQMALELDSLSSSHPIEVDVGHPSEVNQIFDVISYRKGCSILRMLHQYIDDDSFRKGMYNYLTKYKYKNAETNDLWVSLESATNKPIAKVMSTWTKQMGFPVVSVIAQAQNNGILIKLKQKRFLLNKKINQSDYLWCIPISIHTSCQQKEILLEKAEDELFMPNVDSQACIKLNPNLFGFYRIQYSTNLLDRFIPSILNKTLPIFDRLGLVTDLFQLSRAGYTKTVKVLKFLKTYENEDDPTIWATIIDNLRRIAAILAESKCEKQFKEYRNNLLKRICCELGWDTKPKEHHNITKLRPLVYVQMVKNEDERILEAAKKKFDKHISSGTNLQPDMRFPVYLGVVKAGHYGVSDILFDKFKKTDSNEEKYDIAQCLAGSKEPALLSKLLEFVMSDDVRDQDRSVFMQFIVGSSKNGALLVWNYIRANIAVFKKLYESTFLMQNIISAFKVTFTKKEEADELEEFFRKNSILGIERSVEQTIESIRISADWYDRDYEAIEDYLLS